MRSTLFTRLFLLALAARFANPVAAAPPTWDHVLVVIEENKSFTQVIGSGQAPYIDSLAAGGVSLTNMYGLTHPSQPNYLQFFSGSNQGVTSNTDTSGITPFNTPNLGAALIAGGATFTGYSESMPSPGYTGFDANGGLYARRHNPWVQWQAADSPSNNHLAPATNQPFTSLPSSFADLPVVSVVVPNNLNNMHDGTILAGDTWLQQNLGAYATWAQNNNSLLVVTFDEDNSAGRNRIPTVLYGANVRPGVHQGRAEVDLGAGENHVHVLEVPAPRDVHPVRHARGLEVGQVDGVVHVAHGVHVREADVHREREAELRRH